MKSHPRLRRCAALIAAYAVALQALVASFVLPAPVAFGAEFSICQSDEAGGPMHAHEPCLACLAGHCGAAAGSLERVAMPVRWPVARGAAETTVSAGVLPGPVPHQRPHSPRGPPRG